MVSCTRQSFLEKTLMVPTLLCFYHINSSFFYPSTCLPFPSPSLPLSPVFLSFCSSSWKSYALNFVLLLYSSYSFKAPPSESHNLSIHSHVLGTLKTGSPENSLDYFLLSSWRSRSRSQSRNGKRTETEIWVPFQILWCT